LGIKEARAPNEGVKEDKKWKTAKELKRDEEEDAYIKAREGGSKRERQRKEKNFVDVDMRFVEQPRGRGSGPRGSRGGRGSERGDRGRGGRGSFGDRGDRGERSERGDRGGRSDGPRGGGRGGGNSGPTVDEKNFPSLGSK
jgi:plasminogen activator inhibitor 1 RNA-binding protein